MDDIEKLLKQAKKKLKDKQATYYYGVEYASDGTADFRARLLPTKKGTQPVIVAGDSWDELKHKIQKYIEGVHENTLAQDFLLHEISVLEQGISVNKQLLEEYEKLDEA